MANIQLMRGRLLFACSLVFTLLLLLDPPAAARLPGEVQEIIAQNRPSSVAEFDIQSLIDEFSALLYPYNSFVDEPVLLEVESEAPYPKPSITREEAFQDVDFLLSLLKYGYAAYQYFGGDVGFQEARKKIEADLEEQSFPLSAAKFIQILVNRLDLINDGHFAIGSSVLVKPKSMYMNMEHEFHRDHIGYYLQGETDRVYLKSVKGQHPENFMWPSLNDSGAVVYRLGMLEPTGQRELTVKAVLQDHQGQNICLTLTELLGSYVYGASIYERYEVEGLPVISVKRFPSWPVDRRDYVLMQDFFMEAYDLRNEPAIILDLRSHRGGDDNQGYSWIRNFTGMPFGKPAHLKAPLRTATAEKLRSLDMERSQHVLHEFYERVSRPSTSSWGEIEVYLPELIENDTVVVVLTDRRTASGGEHFLDALRHLENVVIMGTNTAGCMLGNSAQTQLPNSKVQVTLGVSLRLPLDLVHREGVGLLPDFWVPPRQALDFAVKFIQNYVR